MKKLILISLFLVGIVSAQAQVVMLLNALATAGVHPVSDTVTNAGVGLVKAAQVQGTGKIVTSVHWEATKISGTVAGTVSLYGSDDGTNYRSISSTTFTATDVASQGGIWLLTGSPVQYYEVTWTGTGTMAASVRAKLVSH